MNSETANKDNITTGDNVISGEDNHSKHRNSQNKSIMPIGSKPMAQSSLKNMNLPDQEIGQNASKKSIFELIFKKKRSERYGMDSKSFQIHDNKKFVDVRFWLFMGAISNSLFQLGGTLTPLENTRQYEVNLFYWCFTFCEIFCLIRSFYGSIRIVGVGMLLHTIRNIIPMYDLEQRKEIMGSDNWFSLTVLQAMGSVMNIMVVVNCFDRGTNLLTFSLTAAAYLGIVSAIRGIENLFEGFYVGTIIFCVISFYIFIQIQKRLHKEVFVEVKQRVEQGNEFKTIFNELDEGIMILKSNKIVQINKEFKKSILFKYFDEDTTNQLSNYTDLYETLELDNERKINEEKKWKILKCVSFLCCWRQNHNYEVDLSNDQVLKFERTEKLVLQAKIFKQYKQKGPQSNAQMSMISMDADTKVSMQELLQLEDMKLSRMIFEIQDIETIINNENKQDSNKTIQSFVQIRKKQYTKQGESRMLLQFINVSKDIMYEQVHAENEFLAITNATVSHELRNPLQSISSQNLKIKLCLKELDSIVTKNQNQTVRQIEKSVKDIIKMIQQSNSIQDSSTNMMGFLVDDLLDFAQINAGKFRKVVTSFDVKDAIQEVISIQKDKAQMGGIKLQSYFYPQAIGGQNEVDSLFQSNNTEEENNSDMSDGDVKRKRFYDTSKSQNHHPVMISTDKRRLQQVLLNIQSNALKFTERGGTVTVVYSLYKVDGKSYCEVQIKDTGMGIKRKDKSKLFKLFGFVQSTEDVNTRGIGLGLVISKKIVERFDGTIGFKSKWNKGSTFGFRILLEENLEDGNGFDNHKDITNLDSLVDAEPENIDEQTDLDLLVFGNQEMPASVINHLPSITGHKLAMEGSQIREINIGQIESAFDEIVQERILIVDDEPYNIDALRIILQCATADKQNFMFKQRVDTASNGSSALEMVKKKTRDGFMYKLILMDCNMPKMDGYQCTALLRQSFNELGLEQPFIIAISGHIEEQYRQRALDAGMDMVIGKPARLPEVQAAIKHIQF